MAKKTKTEADYGKAKSGGDRCQACKWYEVEHSHGCEIVEGHIDADGWCKFWHSGDTRMRRHSNNASLLKYGRQHAQ